jgi:hypothetical protein
MRRIPPSKVRVADIEALLHLTPVQSRQLRDLIRDEMARDGILGNLKFSPQLAAQEKEMLQRILDKVKWDLPFLQKTDLEQERLDELLLARAMINNANEKHNEYYVKVGRVHARAGQCASGGGAEEGLGEEERASHLPIPRLTQRETKPSIVAEELADMLISVNSHQCEATATQEEPEQAPTSPMAIDEPEPTAAAAPVQLFLVSKVTSMWSPAFVVRVVGSTTGAAVHISQLLDQSSATSPSIKDLSLDTFLALVSARVGFDVRGRISAVVPKHYRIAPIDMKVKVASNENWLAVLQVWQNTRRKTCEFVVERIEIASSEG